MKKITCLLIALIISSTIVKSQNTCINAKNLLLGGIDTIPPPGTISASGPDYGCLNETDRQLWYYIPVCQTVYSNLIEFTGNFGLSDTVGSIFYGPFDHKVNNCTELSSNKIISCWEALPGFPFMLNIGQNLIEGNYYYLLVTFSDGIQGNNNTTLDVLGGNITCYECNNQVSVIHYNNLCMVTIDTTINKCVLTWEEFPGTNLAGYNIYRETTLSGVFDSIAYIPLSSMSTYTDLASSPAQHSETYAVTGVDSCGQSNSISSIATTVTSIHLISYPGGNNQANLEWNNVYTNNNFIPKYYIYRNTNGTGWQVIDSVGITLSTITYTDIFAPAGSNQYTVELRKLIPCIPMRMTTTPYQSVFSNTSLTIVTGLEYLSNSFHFTFSPNPVSSFLTLQYNLFSSQNQTTISLFNLYGQKIKTLYNGMQPAGAHEIKEDMRNVAAGIYLVEVTINGERTVKKIVKE